MNAGVAKGIEKLNNTYGANKIIATTIEMGTNQSNWETTLYRVSQQNYDLIICATTQIREPLQRVAARYPDKKYIIFDSEIEDGKASNYKNIHSILFRQNEGGFLAGVLAAKIANGSSHIEGPISNTNKVGFIGGMRNNIIYDFAVGYASGIKYVNENESSNVTLMTSFVGNFNDSTQAKALASMQYTSGADIIFQAASQAGLGVIDAAQTQKKFVIGVDSDQYMYYETSNPTRAQYIMTSVIKSVEDVIFDSVTDFLEGTLEYATLKSYGLKEGIIDLAFNNYFETITPNELKTYLLDLKTSILNGDLSVTSRFDLSLDEVEALFKSLKG